ncbi:hypothetical protein B0T25DRAFT_519397 [Lasiosphaeria hispida]|uniref:BHLH domain-containing protein n=1 Tax=Lasiosphaeria hispida TaxID=260671 RepID=A0AAJ0MC39_9PEZI|nr:hypothetical protein B0T25DRAFT_519397 [Lasiosphaeria hispida]
MAHVLYDGDLSGWDFGDSFGFDGTIHPVQVPQIGSTSHAAPWSALAVDLSAANFGLLSPPSSGVSALSPEPDLFDLGTTTPNCALDGLDAIDLALDLAHGGGGDAFAALHPPLHLDELSNVTWMHTATADDARQAVQSTRRSSTQSAERRRGSGKPKPAKPDNHKAKAKAKSLPSPPVSPPRPASVDVDAAPASDEMVPTFAQFEPPSFHGGGHQPADTITNAAGGFLNPGQSGSSASTAGMPSGTSTSTSPSTSTSTSTKRPASASHGASPSAKRGRAQPKAAVSANKPPAATRKPAAQAKSAAKKSKSVSPARPDFPGQDSDDRPDPSTACPTLEEYQTRMRQWHNRIGKKYRNKLNEQFESLQAVLRIESEEGSGAVKSPLRQRRYDPNADGDYDVEHAAEENQGDGAGKGHVGVGGRTINKAKVLDMARQRIETLTRERETLREEKEALLDQLKARGMQVGM